MKKMSKSEEDPKTRISLLDSNEDIAKNVRKALTDLVSEVCLSFLKHHENLVKIKFNILGIV